MVRVRERLDAAVIRDRECRHPPLLGTLYEVFHLGDTVHVAHLRVTVELHTLHRSIIHTLGREVLALFDADDGTDRELTVELVDRRDALDLDEVSFLDRRCRIFLLAFPEEHFDRDAVRKVRDIEDHEFVSAPELPLLRADHLAADHNLADLTVNIVNIYRIAFKIAPKQNIRILRFPVRDPSVGTFPEAAGKAAFSLLAESLLCKTAAVLSTTGRLSVLVSAGLSCRIRLLLRCSGTRRRFFSGGFFTAVRRAGPSCGSGISSALCRDPGPRVSIAVSERSAESAVRRTFVPRRTFRGAFQVILLIPGSHDELSARLHEHRLVHRVLLLRFFI